MEMEHELIRSEIRIIRWMCKFVFIETKKSMYLQELFGLEIFILMGEKGRLRLFRQVKW